MTLDKLTKRILEVSTDPVVQKLSDVLLDWKTDDSTVEELRTRVERYIGNSWIMDAENHTRVYGLWSAFQDDAISGIDDMTMNERLYCFSLFERFESCRNSEEKLAVYTKLHAYP